MEFARWWWIVLIGTAACLSLVFALPGLPLTIIIGTARLIAVLILFVTLGTYI